MKTKFALLLLGLWLGGGALITARAQTLEYGDAPSPFPTLAIANGARHQPTGPILGSLRDAESDGQPNATATGDDVNPAAADDEDGVFFLTPFLAGLTATIQVVVSSPAAARLDAWMDFNGNSSWADASDVIASSRVVNPGTNTISFVVPATATPGTRFARFRLSSQGGLAFTGLASDGEVEDYQFNVSPLLDFGDAPAPYPTLAANNGARHTNFTTIFLGVRADAEPDGQPEANALGDDNNPAGADDEDGVTFLTPLVPGQTASVQLQASATGLLNAWLDFNADGDWADPGEQIFTNNTLTTGLNTRAFTVPAGARVGLTFGRFRFNSNGGLSFVGPAADGEVEDHQVTISAPMDFGDAPTNNYPTLLAQNGASHTVVSTFCLGLRIDAEADGQPNATATGDDVIPSAADDEDGVTFSALNIGQAATAQVFLTAPAGQISLLNAWMDFNRDGDWADSGEQIAVNVSLTPGNNTLNFNVPSGAVPGTTFARFRLSRQTVSYDGFGQDGEVEDYQVTLSPVEQVDFGDAPAPYPTLLKDNGARHTILPGFQLGARVDAESDGQPNVTATGDDLNGAPDEDGVTWSGPMIQGRPYSVQVTASQNGLLFAWVDFNANGTWADAGEQIATALPLLPGANTVNFNVPAGAHLGTTFARFRLTHQSALLSFVGPAPDGEVEDYQATIIRDRDRCDLDCDGFDFWLTFPGNYAPDTNNPVRASLGILGVPGTIGTVTIPGLGFAANFTIPATRAAYVPLPATADLGDLNDGTTNKGIHVVSSASVRVTAFNQVHYTTDSYLGLSTSIIGTDYIVLGYGNVHTNVPPLNGTQFAIIGTESNTLVRIIPSVATLGHPAGVPFFLTLQPGDCYQLRNTNDLSNDLSGTFVRSDKPIGVFGSHQVANIPSSNVWFADYIVEQLLPVNTWGNEFYTAPLANRVGDTFRCLASQNATTVSLNGVGLAVLNRGQFKEFSITNAGSRITADKPIFVAQYANSSDYDGVVNADPFMLTVQATRHYANSYLVTTPTNDFGANFLHIIAPNAAVASVLVDGGVPGAFTPIAATAYSYRRHPVARGVHSVTANAPISVSVYGWAEYESYGHPACFFVGDVVPPTVSTPSSGATTNVNQSPTPGFVPTPNVSSSAQAQDNCDPLLPTPTQTPTTGTLLPPGIHPITVSVVDALGNIGTTDFTLTVIDSSPVIITCPSNLVVNCQSNNGAFVTFIVTAHSTYDTNVPVVSTPASGTFFPAGTTVVTNVATSLAGLSNSCTFTVTVLCDTRIQATLAGGRLSLSWPGLGTLQFAPQVTGPWSNVVSGVGFYNTQATGQQGYFRVRY